LNAQALAAFQEKDIHDLFCEYQMFLPEDVTALKGMLDIFRECGHDLDAFVSLGLGMSLLAALVMNSMMGSGGQK
jgi:hypothetical protein